MLWYNPEVQSLTYLMYFMFTRLLGISWYLDVIGMFTWDPWSGRFDLF